MNLTEKIFKEARSLGVCGMLKGSENMEQLMRLFLTKQGIEFCIDNRFPDMFTLRQFRGLAASRLGIHIDTPVNLRNPTRVVLIGETVADLFFDDLARHEVILMHGARARITASGYTVVFVNNGGGEVSTVIKDSAKVL